MLVHHVGHLLRDHAGRARSLGMPRDQTARWVLAADAEINDDLGDGTLELPGEPVVPSALGFAPHRFAEEYYRALPEPTRDAEHECGSGCDSLPRPWDQPGEGLARSQSGLLRCQVAAEVLRGCRGLMPGTVPESLRRWAEQVLGSRVDWRTLLAAEVRRGLAVAAGMVDYSYARPARRASAVSDVILPSFVKPVPELAVVVDTSGSMNERLLGQALAQVEGLLRTAGPARRRLRVIPCDAAVHAVQRVGRANQVDLLGGGGTDMGRGLVAASELSPRPDVVVVLTDGLTPWPPEAPRGLRVVVGLLRARTMPTPAWARVVEIDGAA
jgi:predicted metal-dependent peptidase